MTGQNPLEEAQEENYKDKEVSLDGVDEELQAIYDLNCQEYVSTHWWFEHNYNTTKSRFNSDEPVDDIRRALSQLQTKYEHSRMDDQARTKRRMLSFLLKAASKGKVLPAQDREFLRHLHGILRGEEAGFKGCEGCGNTQPVCHWGEKRPKVRPFSSAWLEEREYRALSKSLEHWASLSMKNDKVMGGGGRYWERRVFSTLILAETQKARLRQQADAKRPAGECRKQ